MDLIIGGSPSQMPTPKNARRGMARKKRVLARHPWVRELLSTGAINSIKKQRHKYCPSESSSSCSDIESGPSSSDSDEDAELDWAKGWAILAERRADWRASDDKEDVEHFYSFIRGGRWTARKKRIPFDCYIAKARAGVPAAFARLYGLGQIHSFSIRAYEERACGMMAAEACRRKEHFFNIYIYIYIFGVR